MIVRAKRETIKNVFQIAKYSDHESGITYMAVLSKIEDGEIEKRIVPISEFYEVKESDAEDQTLKNSTQLPKGHNCNTDYAECDQFVCSECGIELQDWRRIERDEDNGEVSYHEYTFRYCPNCGVKQSEISKQKCNN